MTRRRRKEGGDEGVRREGQNGQVERKEDGNDVQVRTAGGGREKARRRCDSSGRDSQVFVLLLVARRPAGGAGLLLDQTICQRFGC